jgi:hypothetical protein
MSDPPPPEGTVLPKKFGDGPPGPLPQTRGSRWTVRAGPEVVLDCDHLAIPLLAEVGRLMFGGAAHTGALPSAPVLVQVAFLTDGKETGTVRVYAEGTRTLQKEGVPEVVQARLTREELGELEKKLDGLEMNELGCR